MRNDPLNVETSLSAEVTPTGIKASAKSRIVAAIDRLGGNAIDLLNRKIEGKLLPERALTEGRIKVIETAFDRLAKEVGEDGDLAARAIKMMLGEATSKQINRDAVLQMAIEDLRSAPPQEDINTPLNDEFLDRIENYASGATTEELRERWGRVLAAEIRSPNTFSRKILRVIDEISPYVAQNFQTLASNRIGGVVPIVLSGEAEYPEISAIVSEGLILPCDPVGLVINSFKTDKGSEIRLDGLTIEVSDEGDFDILGSEPIFAFDHEGRLCMRCYFLSEAGHALASIIEVDEGENMTRFCMALEFAKGTKDVRVKTSDNDGSMTKIRRVMRTGRGWKTQEYRTHTSTKPG